MGKHGHSHGHGHDHSKAGFWTKVSTLSAIPTFLSNAYWLAGWFDVISGFEGNAILRLSWYGISFGVLISGLSAAGATYSHYALNKNNEKSSTKHNSETDHLINDEGHEQGYSEQEEDYSVHEEERKLTALEKLLLAGDYISHVGEDAGSLITFAVAVTSYNDFSKWVKIAIQAGPTLFGCATGVADVRTCANNLKQGDPVSFSCCSKGNQR